MNLWRTIVPLVLCSQALFSGDVLSADKNWYAEGLKAELSGKYQLAIEHYLKSANSGVNQADYALGRLYKELGDDSASFARFMNSAKAGNKLAQFEIGLIYSKGNSAVPYDRVKAIKWLSASAQSGVGLAAYKLFQLEENSKYLIMAAEQGVGDALMDLSVAYEQGLYGLEENTIESERWYQAYISAKE